MKYLNPENTDEQASNLASLMEQFVTVDKVSQQAVQDGDIFERFLPEGITMDTIKKVHEYERLYSMALMLAITDKAAEVFTNDRDITRITARFPIVDEDIFSCAINRKRPSNPKDKTVVELISGSMMSYAEHEGHFTVKVAGK